MIETAWMWFIRPILKHKILVLEIVASALFVQFLSLSIPIFAQVILDKVIIYQAQSTLYIATLAIIIAVSFELFVMLIGQYMFSHISRRIYLEQAYQLLCHLLKLPINYFDTHPRGGIISRVKELDRVINFITGPIPINLLTSLSFSFIFILSMAYYSANLAMLVLLGISLQLLLTYIITPRLRLLMKQKFASQDEIDAYLVEVVNGASTVKSTSSENYHIYNWSKLVSDKANCNYKANYYSGIFNHFIYFINNLTIIAILFVGSLFVIEQKLSIGEFIAFYMLAFRVTTPILKAAGLWKEFQDIFVSIEKIGDILEHPLENDYKSEVFETVKSYDIEFENVDFCYNNGRDKALDKFSLSVKSGEVMAIIGPSGSGKTTAIKLIQRFYGTENIGISIGGVDICRLELKYLREMMSVIPQEAFLFNKTIAENISVSSKEINMEKVIEAANLAGAAEFIERMPAKYDSNVGEFGSELSGGQKQRIAIARAIYRDSKIIIMDEPTSAMDYESEIIFKKHLNNICEGRTVIILSHRYDLIRKANRIAIMNKGHCHAVGTHDELMSYPNFYSNSFNYDSSTV